LGLGLVWFISEVPASGGLWAFSAIRAQYECMLEGPMLEGPMLEGPMLEGPMLEGPMLEGPMLEGPTLEGAISVTECVHL